MERVKEGTGDKVGLMVQFVAQFFGGFIVAFTYDWKLTLIMMSLSPFMIICGAFISKVGKDENFYKISYSSSWLVPLLLRRRNTP